MTYSHNSTRSCKSLNSCVKIYPGARLIECVTKRKQGIMREQTPKRGHIVEFSRKSRRRLMIMFAKIVSKIMPLFVTLTYPDHYPDARTAKRQLKAFLMRCKRRWPEFGYIWRLEFQKRGAPHFHLFMWGIDPRDAFVNMPRLWYQVVGSNDIKHLDHGCKVEKIRSYRGTMNYASKYVCKVSEEIPEDSLGRFWGYGGKIPFSEAVEITAQPHHVYRLMRCLRRYTRMENKSIRSFFVGNTDRWFEAYPAITGDHPPF